MRIPRDAPSLPRDPPVLCFNSSCLETLLIVVFVFVTIQLPFSDFPSTPPKGSKNPSVKLKQPQRPSTEEVERIVRFLCFGTLARTTTLFVLVMKEDTHGTKLFLGRLCRHRR